MKNINDYLPLSNDWNKERLETLKKLYPDLFANERNIINPKILTFDELFERAKFIVNNKPNPAITGKIKKDENLVF